MQAEVHSQLRLPAVLDLAAAGAFLESVRQASAAGPVTLDASGVEVLTLPCVQVVLAALNANTATGVARPSEPFVAAFKDLGLEWREAALQETEMPADAATEAPADMPIAAVAETSAAPETQPNEMAMAKRILTIDDSRTIRDMLNLTLSEAGYEVLQAVDGQDGIDVLAREKVDVVITDINMPKMDGYGVIRHIRGNAEHKTMPILVLTTESEAEKRNIAREAGATGWMVKPFDPERLIATINKVAP